MKKLRALMLLCTLPLAGCLGYPRIFVVHDGIETTVIDRETRMPLSGAFAFKYVSFQESIHVLAHGDEQGKLTLEPERGLEFSLILAEKIVDQSLWICREGYKPYHVSTRGSSFTDSIPAKIYRPPVVELEKSPLPPEKSCSDVEFR
jgi:hypothetical protein